MARNSYYFYNNMKPRVIWLCSWYPNDVDRFTGDFIQRHALAAAQFAHIDIVHVVHGTAEPKITVHRVHADLRETILYTAASHKLSRHWQLRKAYARFFLQYEAELGKPDALHVHVAFPAGIIGRIWKKRWQIPLFLTEHYGIYNNTVADAFPTRSYWFKRATQRAVQAANSVLPVSEALAKGMQQYVGTFPYTVVPNVVDTQLFYPSNTLKLPEPFRFVHVSNMAPVKNVSGLLRAFAKVVKEAPTAQLYLLGAKPEALLHEAAQLGLLNTSVFFENEMAYAEVALRVREAHAGVLFSDSEMLPCSLLEWLCSGLPVVATRVGGIPEVIHEGNGILVDAGNEEALCAALLSMMHHYAQYNTRQLAMEAQAQFSYAAVGRQLFDIYTATLTQTNVR